MHHLKHLVENSDFYRKNLSLRSESYAQMVKNIVGIDEKRKKILTEVEQKRSLMNKTSKEIGELKKNKKDASSLMEEVSRLKAAIQQLEERLTGFQEEQNELMLLLPNLVSSKTPKGVSEDENIVIKNAGRPPEFSFEAKDHVTLGEDLKLLNLEDAAKISGARFYSLKGELARLERALINFMLDSHQRHGFTEMIVPYMVLEKCMYGTGQFPKLKDDAFKIEGEDLYLVPTSEVPLVGLYSDKILGESDLPLKMCAFSPCFRKEAGSYGRDTRGLVRLHQFHKVELVGICLPEKAEELFMEMLERASSILEALELPYRLMDLCSGDIGFHSMRTIDLEVYLPSQKKYREISSVSLCGDFQSRRSNLRLKTAQGEMVYPYTLNGSGLAVGRTMVAILENYQQEDGSVVIPQVLRPYMGGCEVMMVAEKK